MKNKMLKPVEIGSWWRWGKTQCWILRFDGQSFIDDGLRVGHRITTEGFDDDWHNGEFELLAVEHSRIRVKPVNRN